MESQRTVATGQESRAGVLACHTTLCLGCPGHLFPGHRLRSNTRLLEEASAKIVICKDPFSFWCLPGSGVQKRLKQCSKVPAGGLTLQAPQRIHSTFGGDSQQRQHLPRPGNLTRDEITHMGHIRLRQSQQGPNGVTQSV